jgi:hypothetical protein
MKTMRQIAIVGILVATGVVGMGIPAAQNADGSGRHTTIYFVRHGESDETDPTNPTHPLTAKGEQRARILASTFREVHLTHAFSTHTTRARQTVEPTARAHGLAVTQLPRPGSLHNGVTVSDATPSVAAVEALTQSLRQLPLGSSALVGVNAGNIFAVINGLGVPIAPPGGSCTLGSTCVPCVTNTCYPVDEYDRYWILIIDGGAQSPQLISLRYGPSEVSPRP